jgi:hypothetical protein
MKQLFIVFVAILLLNQSLGAQNRSYTLKVMDVKNNPIVAATVRLSSILDTNKVFNSISDSTGSARFNIQANKDYLIRVIALGYKKYEKKLAFENNYTIVVKLQEDPSQLRQVVVTSSKSLIRQEDDKAVVDPEPLAASSTNAMETIEKTPGIFTDADGQIYLNGLTPAGVQINGRDIKMSP